MRHRLLFAAALLVPAAASIPARAGMLAGGVVTAPTPESASIESLTADALGVAVDVNQYGGRGHGAQAIVFRFDVLPTGDVRSYRVHADISYVFPFPPPGGEHPFRRALVFYATAGNGVVADFELSPTVHATSADFTVLVPDKPGPFSLKVYTVPEPSSFALAALGALGLFGAGRRRRARG